MLLYLVLVNFDSFSVNSRRGKKNNKKWLKIHKEVIVSIAFFVYAVQ